jgi:diadenosine tetraphosphatase ApaH/serine/threonine PP2A family protein phosphatase
MARTIIVGDVHGCAAELGRLLDELSLDSEDRVLFVGDLLARGPDSRGVLSIYREVGGRSVLGNHEWRLLLARQAIRGGQKRPRLSSPLYALLHQLRDEDWALLEELPLSMALPEHDLCVVHAGILPELGLASQEAWTLTHVRSIDPQGRPSDKDLFEPWAARYHHGPHIVFGHNSRLGLQLHPLATGLDTGCVYGGQLSALVLQASQRVPVEVDARRQLLVAVPAARCYYAGRVRPS